MKKAKLVTLARHKKYLISSFTGPIFIEYSYDCGFWVNSGEYKTHNIIRIFREYVEILDEKNYPEYFL